MKKFLILMIMLNAVIFNGFSQDNPELLVLNNLSKTVSKVNTQDNTIVQDWLVVDNSPTNTSPNDMLIYNNKLYVIISMTTPALRVFDLTTGLQVEEYEFTAYSNPFAIERVGNALYVTLAGFNQTVVFEVENITSGPVATISTYGWPQDIQYHDPYVYVASTGNWGSDPGFVYVIDPQTTTKIDSISTNRKNPTRVIPGMDDNLLILCAGVWGGSGGSVEIYNPQTQLLEDSLLFSEYLNDIGVGLDGRIFVSTWGSFSVFNGESHEELYSNIGGGNNFYFNEAGEVYTAKFDVDSLYGYDSDMNNIDDFLVGDGPQNIIPLNSGTSDIVSNNPIINRFNLMQNYPNPFNPETIIKFELKEAGNVNLVIYNSVGQKVKTLINTHKTVGEHQANWDGKDDIGRQAASGIYIYQLRAGDRQVSKKMVLMR